MNRLLELVPPNFSGDAAALVIESPEYLAGLRELMPNSKILLMTAERNPATIELCKKFRADFMAGDYARGALPKEPKIFDVIIAEDCLTCAPNFYVTLLELNHLLKDSGFVLTKFFNVRFIGVLENLRLGKFSAHEKRFWAKWDVVKLLDDATYKEIRFLPGEKIDGAEIFSVDAWINFGFDNFSDDLLTKSWLVKARKCTAEVAALKEFYTEEVRAELSRLLHRIEYEIDVEKNFSALIELCRRENIFDDYLADFVAQVVVHQRAINFIVARARDFGFNLQTLETLNNFDSTKIY